ncbi:MAG: serine/threonine protein kinase [Myxococcales bacterium]|nr:serine/threonine protein kinase [Myxococcales bacterium]
MWLAQLRGPAGFEKLVAVKRVKLQKNALTVDGDTALLREARLAALLNHPNIVHTFEVVEQDGEYRIVMELLEGQPLNKLLRGGERPSLPDLVRVLADLCAGLHAAHESTDLDGRKLGVVHRDVSPQNVFVTWDGTVKLLDFGIASFGRPDPGDKGFVKGKLAYMAPEQARAEDVTPRTDVFGVGAILFEVLSGRPLWASVESDKRYAELVAGNVPSIDEVAPEAPEMLRAACRKALAADPGRRFPSADALRHELDAWLEEVGRPHPRRLADLMNRRFGADRERFRSLVTEARDEAQSTEVTELYIPKTKSTPAPAAPASAPPRRRSAAPMVAAGLLGFFTVVVVTVAAFSAWWLKTGGWTETPVPVPVADGQCPVERPVVELSGVLDGDATLGCDRDYRLEGLVEVTDGATLRLEPGAVIRGAPRSVLLIHAGGRLVAEGTPEQPIVFRSDQAEPKAGDWGGVVILGHAPVNLADPRFKGLRPEGHLFGGTSLDDDSGVLRYVRIEHAGTVLAPNNETNGLTLAGVGRGTEVDHVEVYASGDDCFEWFGGTVEASHLVCVDPGDDGVDIQFGFVGRIDNVVVWDRTGSADDRDGVEIDNDVKHPDAEPRSVATMSHVTVCGAKGNGVLVRRGAEAAIDDLVVGGAHAVLDVRDRPGTSILDVVTDAPLAPPRDDDGIDEEAAITRVTRKDAPCASPPVTPDYGGLREDDRWDQPWVRWD